MLHAAQGHAVAKKVVDNAPTALKANAAVAMVKPAVKDGRTAAAMVVVRPEVKDAATVGGGGVGVVAGAVTASAQKWRQARRPKDQPTPEATDPATRSAWVNATVPPRATVNGHRPSGHAKDGAVIGEIVVGAAETVSRVTPPSMHVRVKKPRCRRHCCPPA